MVSGLIIRNSFDYNELNISTDYDNIMMLLYDFNRWKESEKSRTLQRDRTK